MDRSIKEIAKYLIDNGYMIKKGRDYVLTGRFHREASVEGKQLQIEGTQLSVSRKNITGKELYKEFIKQAEVPRSQQLHTGQRYYTNTYSKAGESAFIRILRNKSIDNELFLLSTKLYYKSNVSGKCTIGNYLIKGIWETQYEELKENMKNGNVVQHIHKETNQGENPFEDWI